MFHNLTSRFALHFCQMRAERIETLLPVSAISIDPVANLVERRRIHHVEATRAFGADRREPAVAEDAEVLGHGRLRDSEFALDDGGYVACRAFAGGEELHDASANGVAQYVE